MDDITTVFAASELNKIQVVLEMLRHDLGATGVMLFDEYGHLLLERGRHGDYDVNTFLALLGNAMSASNAVNKLLRDKTAFDLHIHEGTSHELYTSRINDGVFLCLTLEKHAGSSRVGMVWITLRRAVAELRELIEQATPKSGAKRDQEIQNAIGDTLTDALERFESNLPPDNPVGSPSPAKEPRQNAPLGQTPPDLNHPEPPNLDAPHDLTPEDMTDPDRMIGYEQARRLGIIDLDNINRDQGK
jgi:predicted regulator of Ras-like GTPase activity (Roadblock/LC7/MglB family)